MQKPYRQVVQGKRYGPVVVAIQNDKHVISVVHSLHVLHKQDVRVDDTIHILVLLHQSFHNIHRTIYCTVSVVLTS